MGIFDNDELEKKKKLEEEMDLYDLDPEEREAVLSGEYNPWDFDYPEDGEELDEEDYYYEDNE